MVCSIQIMIALMKSKAYLEFLKSLTYSKAINKVYVLPYRKDYNIAHIFVLIIYKIDYFNEVNLTKKQTFITFLPSNTLIDSVFKHL